MNELLPFSDSFINNETQSNEILHIIKVADRFSLLRYFVIIAAFISIYDREFPYLFTEIHENSPGS